jgi:hypothetical protein
MFWLTVATNQLLQMCSMNMQISRALFLGPEVRGTEPDWQVLPAVLAVTRQNSEPNWITSMSVQVLPGPKGAAAGSDER